MPIDRSNEISPMSNKDMATREMSNIFNSNPLTGWAYSAGKMFLGNPANLSGIDDVNRDAKRLYAGLVDEYNEGLPQTTYREVVAPQFQNMEALNADAGDASYMLGRAAARGPTWSEAQSLDYLQRAAAGNAPSAAQIQQQQGLADAMRAQMSMAARARGGNQSLALRQAGMNAAQLQQRGISEAAALRAQEMAQARGQYAGAAQNVAQLEAQRRKDFASAALERYGQTGALDMNRQALVQRGQVANQQAAMDAQSLAYAEQARRRQAMLDAINTRQKGALGQADLDMEGKKQQMSNIKSLASSVGSFMGGGIGGGLF